MANDLIFKWHLNNKQMFDGYSFESQTLVQYAVFSADVADQSGIGFPTHIEYVSCFSCLFQVNTCNIRFSNLPLSFY